MDLGADTFQTFRLTSPSRCSARRCWRAALLAFALSFDEIVVTTFTAGAGRRDPADLDLRQHVPPATGSGGQRGRGGAGPAVRASDLRGSAAVRRHGDGKPGLTSCVLCAVYASDLHNLRYSCAHDATTCRGGEEGRGERGDGQPGAQRQARRLRGHPAGGADRAGRARLRAAHPAARRARPAGRAGAARAAEPDLPGVRRGGRRRAGPARASPRCCAPGPSAASPRPTTSSCCSQQQVSGVVFAGGLYAQADAAARPLPSGSPSAACPVVLVNAADRRPRLPAGVLRRRGGRRAGLRPPAPRSGTSGSAWSSGPRDHVPSAAQAGRRRQAASAGLPDEPVRRAHDVLDARAGTRRPPG